MAETKGGPGDGADPIQQQIESAQMTFQLYNAYVLAGFDPARSLYLVGVLLGAAVRAQNGPVSQDG